MSRTLPLVTALTAVLLCPAIASAQRWSLHAEGRAAAGWTNNIISSPDDPPEGEPAPESDLFYEVRPGARFTYRTRLAVHELVYSFMAYLYQAHSDANSYNHTVSWRAFWATSPRTEVVGGASATIGTVNALTLSGSPDSVGPAALPGGRAQYVNVGADELLRFQVDRNWRTTQSLQVGHATVELFDPNEDGRITNITTGLDIGGTVGADRSWRADALGVTLGTRWVRTATEAAGTGIVVDATNLITTAELGYRRDISRYWGGEASAGVAYTMALEPDLGSYASPTAGIGVHYLPEWGHMTAGVRRMVGPNLYIAQTTVTDTASASLWLPLPYLAADPREPDLSFGGSIAAVRGEVVTFDESTLSGRWNSQALDTGFFWTPRASPSRPNPISFQVGLRYQFVRQDGDPDLPYSLPSFQRHTVLITVAGRWPNRVAASIPVRAGLRVDGSDMRPMGDQRSGSAEY